MLINDTKIIIDGILKRNKYSGRYKIAELNEYFDLAQTNLINKNVKREGLEITSFNADNLAPLKRTQTTPIDLAKFANPSGFMYLIGLSHKVVTGAVTDIYDINLLRENEFNKKRKSYLTPPTVKYPVAKWMDNAFSVLPETIQSIDITYLKQPEKAVWGFTLDANGREVFDANSSVDLELPRSMQKEIVSEVLALMGVSLREGVITNFGLKQQENE